jgi:hypothetical protein
MTAFWLRGVVIASCCVAGMCLVSCEAVAGHGPGGTTPSGGAGGIHAGYDQNGTSITLHPGQTLIVTLPTTYWTIQGSSNPQALAPVGAPIASLAPKDSCTFGGCLALQGSTIETFRAVGPGVALVTASRVTCGEAMGCVGSAGRYQLTVTVTTA